MSVTDVVCVTRAVCRTTDEQWTFSNQLCNLILRMCGNDVRAKHYLSASSDSAILCTHANCMYFFSRSSICKFLVQSNVGRTNHVFIYYT